MAWSPKWVRRQLVLRWVQLSPSPKRGVGAYTNTHLFPHSKNTCLVLKFFETLSAIKNFVNISLISEEHLVILSENIHIRAERLLNETKKHKLAKYHHTSKQIDSTLTYPTKNKIVTTTKRIAGINRFHRPLKTPSRPYLGRIVNSDSRPERETPISDALLT